MITVGAATWTDRTETFDILGKIEAQETRALILPRCETEHGGCGETTQYMVVPDTREGKRSIFGLFLDQGMVIYRVGKHLYVPMRICHKCSGRKEGYQYGFKFPEHKKRRIRELVETGTLTDLEKREWLEHFEHSFKSGYDARMATREESEAKPNRYKMRK